MNRKSSAEEQRWVSEHDALAKPPTALPVAALAGVFGGLLLLVPVAGGLFLSGDSAHTATRLATVAAALATVFAAAQAAVRSRGSLRWGWGLLAVAGTGWTLSNLLAAYSEIVEGMRLPVPSVADIPAGLAVLLAASAVVALLGAVLPSAARMRALLDGLLIASTLLFVGWELALREVFLESGEGPERALALGYPLADVAVLALLLVSLSRLKLSGPWLLLLIGFGLHAVSRAAFAYLDLVQIEDTGVESAIWIAGTLAIAAAALTGGTTFERRRVAPRAGTAADILVPCIPLAIAIALAGRRLAQGPLDTFLLMNAGAIVVLLVARQLLAQVEYLDLYRQLEASVMHGLDVLTVVGPGGIIAQQTGPVERVLGYRTGQLIGKAFRDLVHPQGREEILPVVFSAQPPPAPPTSLQLLLQRGDGEWTLTETTISDLSRHPDVGGYLLTSRDAGARRGLDSQLSPETLNDPLTGVGNRVLFLDRLNTAVRRSALTPELITVLVIDIDGFTDINDSLGHAIGDQLLVEAADRLKAVLRKEDTLARLGADEFGILLESDEDSPVATAERVLSRLRQPMDLQGRNVLISASAGVATGSFAIPTAEDLLRSADLALNQARSSGRSSISVFRKDLHLSARRRVEVESDLRRALENNELLLHFQPVVDLPSGRIAGAEALVRWNRPDGSVVSPGEFVAVAEESDLALSLGRWILNEACRRAQEFQAIYSTDPVFYVGVNLSGRQLSNPDMVDEVRHALQTSGLKAGSLVLEIPQTALADEDDGAVQTLNELRSFGVQVAIDDFGTGWSSLNRLRSFPIDKIKIDRPFVADITRGDDEAPLLTAMVAMAHSLGVATIAEGVETVEQLAVLWRQGCQSAQGFGVYPPIPADALIRTLGEHELMLEAIPYRPLSEDSQGYIDAINAAVRGDAPLLDLTKPLLSQLLRITGGQVAVLTRDEPRRPLETVVCSATADGMETSLVEQVSLPINDSPTQQVRRGGPAFEVNLAGRFPYHPLVSTHGALSFLGAPVVASSGVIFGTLFVAGLRPGGLDGSSAQLVELVARLLGNHPEVQQVTEAASAAPRVTI